MLKHSKRIAAVAALVLFISGFFFLDEGNRKPASGEKETVIVDNEEIMAVRMAHNAATYKLNQLQQEEDELEETEQVLSSYLNEGLLQDSLLWLDGEEEEEVDLFMNTDTTDHPVIADETENRLILEWTSKTNEVVVVTYKKPNNVWVASDIMRKAEE